MKIGQRCGQEYSVRFFWATLYTQFCYKQDLLLSVDTESLICDNFEL